MIQIFNEILNFGIYDFMISVIFLLIIIVVIVIVLCFMFMVGRIITDYILTFIKGYMEDE